MKNQLPNSKITLVLLWVTVLLNMIFADIFSIIIEFVDGGALEVPGEVKTTMAIAALVTNVPILMVILSWVLPLRASRLANMIAAPFTILYVVGGGFFAPHYIIIGGIEVVLLLVVFRVAYRWK